MDYIAILNRLMKVEKVGTRQQLAKILGFPTYSHLFDRIKTTKKQKNVPLLQIIIEHALEKNLELDWLIAGKSERKNENNNVVAIDAATRVLNEVVEETDTQDFITDKVKQELVQVIREELAENENRTREKFFRVIRAMAGG